MPKEKFSFFEITNEAPVIPWRHLFAVEATAINAELLKSIFSAPNDETASKIKSYLNLKDDSYVNLEAFIKNHEIESFEPLMTRIEDDNIAYLQKVSESGWDNNRRLL